MTLIVGLYTGHNRIELHGSEYALYVLRFVHGVSNGRS